MATNNEILNRLIATGQAQFGTYVNSGGLMVLPIPNGKGCVITQMTLKAFADLPAGATFANLTTVVQNAWHMLRVINNNNINVFHARHELMTINTTPPSLLPIGQTQWDTFLNYENEVIFELTHSGNRFSSYAFVVGTLSGALDQTFNQQPPYGYGKAGVVGSLNAIREINNPADVTQVRPMSKFTPANPAGGQSYEQFQWAINPNHALNPPLVNIPFGEFTMPILEVQYILYNKNPDWTFSNPV